MKNPLRLFALGSCRVSRPIRHLEDAGTVIMTNRQDPYWYTHTSKAARQLVEIAQGGPSFPEELRPFIAETDPKDRSIDFDGREAIRQADAVVIEVATLNAVMFDSWALNVYLLSIAQKAGLLPDFLHAIQKERLSDDDVIDDILAIRAIFNKPVLVLDHLYYTPATGEPWRSRTDITTLLSKASKHHNFSFLPTAEVISQVGQAAALEDCDHYRKAFEPQVGSAIFECAVSML